MCLTAWRPASLHFPTSPFKGYIEEQLDVKLSPFLCRCDASVCPALQYVYIITFCGLAFLSFLAFLPLFRPGPPALPAQWWESGQQNSGSRPGPLPSEGAADTLQTGTSPKGQRICISIKKKLQKTKTSLVLFSSQSKGISLQPAGRGHGTNTPAKSCYSPLL